MTLHVVVAATVGILAQARFHPPEKLEIIPVQARLGRAFSKQADPGRPPPRPQEQAIPDRAAEAEAQTARQTTEPKVKPVEKKPEPTPEAKQKVGEVKSTPTPVTTERPSGRSRLPVRIELEGAAVRIRTHQQHPHEDRVEVGRAAEAKDGIKAKVRRIERNGKVVDAVVEPSGDPVFDASTVRAAQGVPIAAPCHSSIRRAGWGCGLPSSTGG
ncbi:MAG: hypothetical protein R3E12_19960 [Candidatus Eisenbacteria bacterium]